MNRIIGVSTKLEGLTRERFAAYRENGIGAVEVSVAEVHFDELDLATVAKEMRAEGLDTWSFHLRFFPFNIYNIARLNPDERRFAVDYQREWIKRAGAEGFRYAIVHPSGEPISDEKRPEAMKAACESLDLLAEEAKRAGIVLAGKICRAPALQKTPPRCCSFWMQIRFFAPALIPTTFCRRIRLHISKQ